MIIKYKKNCDCKSTSTENAVRWIETKVDDGVNIKCIYYQIPSCDKCGEPWIKDTNDSNS